MTKKIIICCVALVAFVAIMILGANNYRAKIEKDNIVIAREKVKAANTTHELYLLNEARELLKSVDGEEKEELLESIEKIEKEITNERVLNKYIDKINKLKTEYSEEEYEALKEEIYNIEYEEIKNELLDKINNLNREEKNVEKTGEEEIVLETVTGNMKAYDAKCEGCNGYVASGDYVLKSNLYKDSKYGDVYILKGDSSYSYGTIVKIKNVPYFEKDIYAIILDRGETVGKDKDTLFEILLEDDKAVKSFGLNKDVTFEIIRIGY